MLVLLGGVAVVGFGASAQAGCLSGAATGGVAGHVVGHHGLLGAAVGCAVGITDLRAAASSMTIAATSREATSAREPTAPALIGRHMAATHTGPTSKGSDSLSGADFMWIGTGPASSSVLCREVRPNAESHA
jgi:hypothetical protein